MHDRARLKNKIHEKSCTKHDWIFSTISNPGMDQRSSDSRYASLMSVEWAQWIVDFIMPRGLQSALVTRKLNSIGRCIEKEQKSLSFLDWNFCHKMVKLLVDTNGRIQTLLRESVKFLTFGKILWSRDSPLKVGPLLKIWAPLAQRTLIYWPKCPPTFPEGFVP